MVIPGAPLMISALTTSFCGTGAISDGSLVVAVEVGGAASDERARATNEERSRAGLARAPEQARRKDIGFSYGTVRRSNGASAHTSDSLRPNLVYGSHGL